MLIGVPRRPPLARLLPGLHVLTLCLLLPVVAPAAARLAVGNHTLRVASRDPRLGVVSRRFWVTHVPPGDGGGGGDPAPILLGFHGQSNSPESWGPRARFTALAKRHGWLTAFPAAVWEPVVGGGAGATDSTWNIGTQDDDSVCVAGTTGTQCLRSCHRLGRCRGRCNWATCHDDVRFVDQLLAFLGAPSGSPRPVFVVGESNGGMFIHRLLSEFPGRFVAAAPAFGLPLLGRLAGERFQLLTERGQAARTRVLQLHDRSDTVIPWQGGPSAAGWIYESLNRSLGVWAGIHGCLRPAQLPEDDPGSAFDGGPTHVRCRRFRGCGGDGAAATVVVGWCMYDGGHGDWPEQPRADDLVASFFLNASAAAAAAAATALRGVVVPAFQV